MLFVALILSCPIFAQTKLIGTILDGATNNEPLIGASVIVKGTSAGGVSDIDGNFSITVPHWIRLREPAVRCSSHSQMVSRDLQGLSPCEEGHHSLYSLNPMGYGILMRCIY